MFLHYYNNPDKSIHLDVFSTLDRQRILASPMFVQDRKKDKEKNLKIGVSGQTSLRPMDIFV